MRAEGAAQEEPRISLRLRQNKNASAWGRVYFWLIGQCGRTLAGSFDSPRAHQHTFRLRGTPELHRDRASAPRGESIALVRVDAQFSRKS